MENELLQQGLVMTGSAGNYAYLQIPADKIRHLVDSAFPGFAKNAVADVVSGHGHRWVAGHDLLLDVPQTFLRDGPVGGTRHLGHILLTDFPTKSGVPIPGFSKCGLGDFLVNTCHIPQGYLSINLVDGVVGVFACTEGFCDLLMVCAENTRMTPQLFFDTFVEGCAEVALGCGTENPLLVLAGGSQVLAGIVSSAYTVTNPVWYVAPIDFFGGALTGGVIGFAVSKFVFHHSLSESLRNAARSCAMSGLFAIGTGFGIAALCGFVGMGIGKFLASKDNRELIRCYRISRSDLERVINGYAELHLMLVKDRKLDSEEPWIKLSLSPYNPLGFGSGDTWGLSLGCEKEEYVECEWRDMLPLLNQFTCHVENERGEK